MEQPDPVRGVPVHGRDVGSGWSVRSFSPKPFYDSMNRSTSFWDNAFQSSIVYSFTSLKLILDFQFVMPSEQQIEF